MSCPEGVQKSPQCCHDDAFVCCQCRMPVCSERWAAAVNEGKTPKTITNDNFIGYVHEFIPQMQVTWLEATIASPVFAGLVTYYVEGKPSQRRNLLDSTLSERSALGRRVGICSLSYFLEKMSCVSSLTSARAAIFPSGHGARVRFAG